MTANLTGMDPLSLAGRELSLKGVDARRRKTAAVNRVVAAYRTLRADLPAGTDDIALLSHLADELEVEAREHATAS